MKNRFLFFSPFSVFGPVGLLWLLMAVVSCTAAHSRDEKEQAGRQVPSGPGLKDVSAFHIGASVRYSLIKNDDFYRKIVLNELNSLTAENAMQMDVLSVDRNSYNWAEADSIVQFALEYGFRVHGHALVCQKSVPGWMKTWQTDREGWKEIFRDYIHNVVAHWQGKIASWDVVDEAMGDDGRLKTGFWFDRLGADYIELAFQYAHEADPEALLFYNDYGHESNPVKRKAISDLLLRLKQKGVPVDGTGLQMHTTVHQQPDDIREAILEAAHTDMLVHVSALDVAVNPDRLSHFSLTDKLLRKQKAVYKEVVKAMLEVPSVQRYGITLGGVADSDSLKQLNGYPDWPLLFDSFYQRKPGYEALYTTCQ